MAAAAIIKAIIDRWTAEHLDNWVTGGLHTQLVPKGTAMPYAVLDDLGESVYERANAGGEDADTLSEYRRRQVQIRLHSNGGMADAAAMAGKIRSAFDYASLGVTGMSLLYCRNESELFTSDPDVPGVTIWAGTYNVLAAQPVALVNS